MRREKVTRLPRVRIDPFSQAFIATVIYRILAFLYDLPVPHPHSSCKSIFLRTDVRYSQTNAVPFTVVQQGEDNETVPDVVRGKAAAKLPTPR